MHFNDLKPNSSELNDIMIYFPRMKTCRLNAAETLKKERHANKIQCEIYKYQSCKFIYTDYTQPSAEKEKNTGKVLFYI